MSHRVVLKTLGVPRPLAAFALVAFVAALPLVTRASAQTHGDQARIRQLDAAWLKAVAAKDATAAASFYADNGTLLVPGAPVAHGKDAIHHTWAGMMAAPGFALTFKPTSIKTSRRCDLAYELGEYALTLDDSHGVPHTSRGEYAVVWARRAGHWKAVVDAVTTAVP